MNAENNDSALSLRGAHFATKQSPIPIWGHRHLRAVQVWLRFARNDQLLIVLLLALILFAFALRMFHAADSLMWGDEGFSVFSANRDLLTITLDTTTIDPHPPLYYYLLHFYFAIAGYSELAIRFFSVFFGTATIALVWVIGKRMFDARVGLLATFFATIAPFAVQYSQEIRMYALALFLTALGLYLFVRLYVRPVIARAVSARSNPQPANWGLFRFARNDTWGWWLSYALTMLLALYTLYHTALLFLATGLALLPQFRTRRAFVLRWFAVAFGVVAIFLPWLYFKYVSAFAGIKDVAGDTTPMDIATFVARGFAAISVGTTIPLSNAFALAGLYAALIALALLIALATRTAKMYDALLLLSSTIPILAYYPLYLAMPLYRGRLFALACIPLMILLARSATRIVQRARPFGKLRASLAALPIALLIVGTSAYSVGNYFTNYSRYSAVVEDYLPAIHEIEQRAQPGDFVLFHAYWHQGYFLSYYHGAQLQYGALENQVDLDAAVSKPRNVWAIVQALPHHDAEDWLAQNAFPLGEQTYGKMRVLMYRAGTPARGETLAAPIGFDNGMQLLGYHLNDVPIESGRGIVTVQLDWRAAQKIADDYTVSVRVTNARGDIVWARADAQPSSGTQPTSAWQPGQVVTDHHALTIPPGMPPENYSIQIAVYESKSERAASIAAPENRRGLTAAWGSIVIEHRAAQVSAPIPPNDFNARFNEIALVGLNSLPDQVAAGDGLPLTLYWRATEKPLRDYLALIEVVDATGAVRVSVKQRLASETFPTREWTVRETWLDKIVLTIPADAAPGVAIVRINLIDESSGRVLDRNPAELARVKIVAR